MSNSLLNKISWSAVASGSSLLGRFIVQVMIARMLGPDGVGRISYVVWLIEIANILSCFGLSGTITRYLAELYGQQKNEQASYFAQWILIRYMGLSLIGSATVGVLFFCSSQYAGAETILPILMLLFLAYGLQSINQAALAGQQRFDLLARINLIATVAQIVGVPVGGYFYGVTGVLYGYFAGALFPAIYSFTLLRGISFRRKIESGLKLRVWKFAFNTWLAMIVSAFVWSRMEIFFLERYCDLHEVAMFTIGLTFAVMVQQVTSLFSGSFMAHFSGLVGDGNHELIQRHYEITTKLMALVVIPAAFGCTAIMPVLLPLIFGMEFVPAVPNAMVLTASSALSFSTIGSSLVYAKERSGFIALGGFAGAILSVAAGFFIVPPFGSWGAVWSRAFVQSFMIALGTWFIITQLHFSYPFKSLMKIIIAAGLCGLSAWCVIKVITFPYAGLTIAILLGGLVYILCIKKFQVLGSEELSQLKRIANRLPSGIQGPINSTFTAIYSK